MKGFVTVGSITSYEVIGYMDALPSRLVPVSSESRGVATDGKKEDCFD